MSKEDAFSLVELLTVIAIVSILGVISALSVVRYRGNTNLKEAAREITGDIQLCKQRAVAETTHYRILIIVESNAYIIQKKTSNENWTNMSSIKNIGEHDSAVKIVGHPTHGDHKIIFQPRGTTNAGTLIIRHDKILSTASIVTSLMGRVRIDYDLK